MIHKLRELKASGGSIKVAIVGCGAMGCGVAWQVARTPGMEVALLADFSHQALARAAARCANTQLDISSFSSPPSRRPGQTFTSTNALEALQSVEYDVLVECTNSIYEAALFCLAAIDRKAHVVLMNAEVDLALGSLLAHRAKARGVVVTSDAGDQHGVLATMADEIALWGFRIVQAGNMKGFLHRYADADYARPWAEKQKGSVIQTVSYTDGSKMNIEQAIIGNYLGLTPLVPGMQGPRCEDIRQVIDVFNFDSYGDQGRVDYTVGVPWPGGGVYIVGHCDDADQDFLLNYYKVTARRPYYLFFRPYHLCHIETPRAIAQCYFDARPVISPPLTRPANDVYAYAKKDLAAGQPIRHAIGGDELYSLVNATGLAAADDAVPTSWLEAIGDLHPHMKVARAKDEVIRFSDLEIPETPYLTLLKEQQSLLLQPS